MIRAIRRCFCRIFHRDISFAGGKTYRCRTCQEAYETPWQ